MTGRELALLANVYQDKRVARRLPRAHVRDRAFGDPTFRVGHDLQEPGGMVLGHKLSQRMVIL